MDDGRDRAMSDDEKVRVIEKVVKDVAEGWVTTKEQIEQALEPLGADVGPFGGASFEMDVALEKLRSTARSKRIAY